MIPSIYDQFIKKIPHDSERTYDPTFQMPVVDTVPSDLREWVGTSSLDRSRTVTRSRFGEGAPSSHNHHVERMADGEIDLGNGNGNFSEYEIEIRPSANGAGNGNGLEWGEGGLECGTDDKGDRDQVERKDKKDKKEKEERVWKKPKGKEGLREYSNRIAISQRETQNLLDSYVGFVSHPLFFSAIKLTFSYFNSMKSFDYLSGQNTCHINAKHATLLLKNWVHSKMGSLVVKVSLNMMTHSLSLPQPRRTNGIRTVPVSPAAVTAPKPSSLANRLVVLPKAFAILQDGRKRKRTKEMMDKLKDLVEWHKSNFEGDGSDP